MTGGIASGKSSVAIKLQSLGAGVVHCDKLAHDLYEPGKKCFNIIIDIFGRKILTKDGKIDRKILGNIVFNDKVLKKINTIKTCLYIVQHLYCFFFSRNNWTS